MHGLLLLWRLAVHDAVPQVSEILQPIENPSAHQGVGRGEDKTQDKQADLLVEEDEAQQRPRHGPLVPAVFKDDDVQHRGQHLQEHHRTNWLRVGTLGM